MAGQGGIPYQVALTFDGSCLCGGSIVNTVLILTAAHCVRNVPPGEIQVTAGTRHPSNLGGPPFAYEQIRTAENIYIHEGYNSNTKVNDIALIKLAAPLHYTVHVRNVTLPNRGEEFEGKATVSGWGRTREGGLTADVLRSVVMPIVPYDQCKRSYSYLTSSMMCSGIGGRDSCQGDSGGPVVCKRRSDRQQILCGVVSTGRGCGRSGFPGVNTKVSSNIDWIETKMSQTSSTSG